MPVFQITHQTNNQTNTDAHIHRYSGEHNTAQRHRTTSSINQSIPSSKVHKTDHFDLENIVENAIGTQITAKS